VRRTWAVAVTLLAVLAVGCGGDRRAGEAEPPQLAPGLRPVSFHGLTIDVPQHWPVNALQCTTPTNNTVVMAPLALRSCWLGQPPGLSVVELAPLGWGPIDHGEPGRARIVVRRPELDAQVTITSPDAALARQIAGSLRRTPVDFAGCADRVGQLRAPDLAAPQRPGADRVLVPGQPVQGGVCRYEAGWLARSASLTGDRLAELVGTLNRLLHGSSRRDPQTFLAEAVCPEERARGAVVHLRYGDGQPLTVWVNISGCDQLGAANGTVQAQRRDALPELMMELVGLYSWPGGVIHQR
jgi:hypothetical protein